VVSLAGLRYGLAWVPELPRVTDMPLSLNILYSYLPLMHTGDSCISP